MARNETDYDFPPMWGEMTVEQKHTWFVRERVFRQAVRQDTTFGRRYRAKQREEDRLDTDEYRYD